MNEQKSMRQSEAIHCPICHQTFHNQEELQKHNRESHPQGQMKDQGHQGHAGSGSASERSQGAERNPNFDKGQGHEQERKAPGSEQKQPDQKRHDQERREPNQKRAAS